MSDFEHLVAEVMEDVDARCAAMENRLRRSLYRCLSPSLEEKGWTVGEFARNAKIPYSHARRILLLDVGGFLPLSSVIRAADSLVHHRPGDPRFGAVYFLPGDCQGFVS